MYKGKSFLAVVPARGGSKGIPHKNIVKVNGKELISYTLDAAKKSKYIDKILVSTEDKDVKYVAQREGAFVLDRPMELAQDASKTIDVLLHVVNETKEKYDYLILLQPTQPLRLARHIDEAIEQIVEEGLPSLVSVSPVKNHPLLIRQMDQRKELSNLLPQGSTVRRQDFPDYYVINGAIYINKIADLSPEVSLNDNAYGYEMPSEYDLDVDEPLDLVVLEAMLHSLPFESYPSEAKTEQ